MTIMKEKHDQLSSPTTKRLLFANTKDETVFNDYDFIFNSLNQIFIDSYDDS